MDKQLIQEKTEIIKKEISSISQYIDFEIKNDEDETEATRIIQLSKKIIKTIDNELYNEQIESARKTLALIKESRNKLVEVPEKVSETLRQKIIEYKNEKKRIELEKIKEEIQKKDEEEKDILSFFEINKEKENEIKANIDNQIKNATIEVDKKIIEKNKMDGVITVKRWVVDLIDIKELLQAIIDGKAPLELITFNQSFANNLVKTVTEYEKKEFNIPGLKARQIDELRFKSI